jgi:hypothetical protein
MNKIWWGQNCNLERIGARIGIRPRFGLIHSHVCGCGLLWKNIILPLNPHVSAPPSSFLSFFSLLFFLLLLCFTHPNIEIETREWDWEIEREIRERVESREWDQDREPRDWEWDRERWGRPGGPVKSDPLGSIFRRFWDDLRRLQGISGEDLLNHEDP